MTTITRAVLLMGFERIRGIATGLLLFDHLQQRGRKGRLADVLTTSFFSGMLGRTLAEISGFADSEETFISSLFHRLGRILVAFYLPAEYAAIEARGEAGTNENAVLEVLGTSFQALGVAIAAELRLPAKLVQALVPVKGDNAPAEPGPSERLGCLATLANDITDVLASSETGPDKRAEIERLLASYAPFFEIDGPVDDLIALALRRLRESSATFNLDLPGSRFVAGLAEWAATPGAAAPTHTGAVAETSSAGALVSEVENGTDASGTELPETVLTRGLHEITSLLVDDSAVDDVLRVTLETIYRALGVGATRVFFLLKDPAAPVAHFRFGFGQAAAEMRAWFDVPIHGSEDLFSLAFTQHKDIVVRDPNAPEVLRALPEWYTGRGVDDRYLVLLPLVVDQRSVGLFYVDGDRERLGVLTPPVVNYLKVLRGQAVLAIRQKASRPGRR